MQRPDRLASTGRRGGRGSRDAGGTGQGLRRLRCSRSSRRRSARGRLADGDVVGRVVVAMTRLSSLRISAFSAVSCATSTPRRSTSARRRAFSTSSHPHWRCSRSRSRRAAARSRRASCSSFRALLKLLPEVAYDLPSACQLVAVVERLFRRRRLRPPAPTGPKRALSVGVRAPLPWPATFARHGHRTTS